MLKYFKITLFSILVFSVGFVSNAALENDQIADFLRTNATTIAVGVLIVLLATGLALFGALWLMHRWLTQKTGVSGSMEAQEMITALVDYATSPEGVRDPTPAERQRAAVVHLGLWLKRRTATQFYAHLVIVTLGGLVGAATLFVLIEQNEKLQVQNELFSTQNTLLTDQNIKIELQTQANIANAILLEGTRRASLSQEMSTLFADIREEVGEIDQRPNDKRVCIDTENPVSCQTVMQENRAGHTIVVTRNHLSATLTKRVTSYAEQSTPYHVALPKGSALDMSKPLEDQFYFKEYSPERALLLQELLQNNVALEGDASSFNFSSAQLSRASLTEANLTRANLTRANLTEAVLWWADLTRANLSYANLSYAVLRRGDMQLANLNGADLNGAFLVEADLSFAKLTDAKLTGADLTAATLWGADLTAATLWEANLRWADLGAANLTRAELRGASLRGTKLFGAELVGANLIGALFTGELENPILLQATNLQADQTYAAWRFVDFTGVDNLTPSSLAHSFGDGTVILPENAPRPCHWSAKPLKSAVEDIFALPDFNDPYIGRWRGWVEANGGDWPTSKIFESYKDVTPIAPPKDCPLIADFN